MQIKNESSAGFQCRKTGKQGSKDFFTVKQKSDLLKLEAKPGNKTVVGMNIRKEE